MEESQKFISLIVVNVRALEVGLSPKISFDKSGGIIGANSESDWYLRDESDSIAPSHCKICFIDGAFCLKELAGATFINSSNMPLGANGYARLGDEDDIRIGSYDLRVFLDREAEIKESSYSLEQLFTNKDVDLLDAISALNESANVEDDQFDDLDVINDKSNLNLDPLLALELEEEEEKETEESLLDDIVEKDLEEDDLLNHINKNDTSLALDYIMQADGEDDIGSAITLGKLNKGNYFSHREQPLDTHNEIAILQPVDKNNVFNEAQVIENYSMDDNILDLLEQEVAKNFSEQGSKPPQTHNEQSPVVNNHVLGGPMLNGLGVDIGSNSSIEDMQALSSEIGKTLKACVQGLLDLHTQVKGSRYGVMHRSLQPIEDNPLRLGLSYQDTIRVMFDQEQSIVHLSAAASVEESISMVKIHNEAVQYATNLALEQILHSLSPAVLLKRFSRYSRKFSNNVGETDESWAWKMYENYYQELTSNRQQGFEKLFWEIFEQSYDKKVREKHAE